MATATSTHKKAVGSFNAEVRMFELLRLRFRLLVENINGTVISAERVAKQPMTDAAFLGIGCRRLFALRGNEAG